MTVGELIEELKKLECPEAEVIVTGLYSASTDDVRIKLDRSNRTVTCDRGHEHELPPVCRLETDLCTG